MPEINLLGPNHSKPAASLVSLMPLFLKVAAAVLILMIGYYGFVWFKTKSEAKSTSQLNQQISQERTEISQNDDRNQLLTRQGQLADLRAILSKHLYWSKFFNQDLPKISLKSAAYSSISVKSDGTVSLLVSVPTYDDLDKFMQVFDIADFNKDFSNVQIQSITKSQSGNGLMTNFRISMKYNTTNISYEKLAQSATQK